MRTLERNKTTLWYVEPLGNTPLLDAEGYETGEYTTQYSTPVRIRINIYPSDGSIAETIFGVDESYDMIAVTNDILLGAETLLFLQEPTSNYDKTYDFRVDAKKISLNTMVYGLRSRT